jgi:hypothetical protein
MKFLLKVVGAIIACVILALVVLSITGLDPNQRRAGLWLRGNVGNLPADWSFENQYPTLMVETHPWYLIPHAVTIYFVTYQGDLYLHADYPPGGKFPGGKAWTANVGRNPNVRIKLADQVFDGKTVLVTDPAMFDALFLAFRQKYPNSPYSKDSRRPDVYFLHFVPG